MTNLHTDYYDSPELWGCSGEELHPSVAERIRATVALIPPDVRTVLDVGCGDGAITNELARRYEVVGLDISAEALKHVKTKTYQGTLETAPFAPKSFDVVAAFEVLEHLPLREYELARRKMADLARRFVIVTVPYREPPQTDFTKCPVCGTTFNVFCHLRRFDKETLETLIPGMRLARFGLIGPRIKHWNSVQLYIRQNVLGVWKPSDRAVCPQCGNGSFPYSYGLRHYATAALRRLSTVLW
ncbi:unnamed protein product, partial [marine sediment metagenome]